MKIRWFKKLHFSKNRKVATREEQFTPTGPLDTPILFLVFNRPDVTAQVFDAIRQAKPPRLYVAADGPREARAGEADRVAKVRKIATEVDWPCEVKTLFRDKNLGCKHAVSGAITWFFEHEEQGIILEDDCLPSQSFFWYCEDLLEKYKYDERIFIVSGYNKQGEWRASEVDYFFSFLGGIWGWASWKRAWKYYDGEMNELEQMCLSNIFVKKMGKKLGRLRENQLIYAKKKIQAGEMSSWGYPWGLSRHVKGGLACVPKKSLIRNIGFGLEATHTSSGSINSVCEHEIDLPLRYNSLVCPDLEYDLLFLRESSLWARILEKLKK